MLDLGTSLSLHHSLYVLWPETNNVLTRNLVHAKLIPITTEAVTNGSAIVTEEVSRGFVLSAEPELLVPLKERVVIEKLSVEHREAAGVDIDLTKKLGGVFYGFRGAHRVTFWVNNDGIGERISLDTVCTTSNGDDLSTVFTNDLVFNLWSFVKYRRHLLDELPVSEHELVD